MNWVANRIPAKNCIFFSSFYSLFFICVLFYFSCPLLFLILSLLWFVFPFLAFSFIFFCIGSTRKGIDMRLLRLVRKSRSWHPSCYVATEAEYLNIATFHTVPMYPYFPFSWPWKGFSFYMGQYLSLFSLGRLNPNQKPLPFLRVILASGDTNKYWVTQNMYIAVLGSWSENNSFQAVIYQE